MSLNHVRPWRNIYRRKSRQIHVECSNWRGCSHRCANNDKHIDHKCRRNNRTVQAAAEAGADIVRVSVPDQDSSKALKKIVKKARAHRGRYSFPL